MENLFVYGTLKEPEVQKKVIGRIINGKPDTLIGYKKSSITINNDTYPILIAKTDGEIKGVVLSITEKELKLIDKYETEAYRRIKVILGSATLAWVYVK